MANKTVKIGGQVFTVVEQEGTMPIYGCTEPRKLIEGPGGELAKGLCHHHEGQIDLIDWMAPDATRQTLWHEIMHAALLHAQIHPDDHPEKEMEILAWAVVQVLQDNPWMRETSANEPRPD